VDIFTFVVMTFVCWVVYTLGWYLGRQEGKRQSNKQHQKDIACAYDMGRKIATLLLTNEPMVEPPSYVAPPSPPGTRYDITTGKPLD